MQATSGNIIAVNGQVALKVDDESLATVSVGAGTYAGANLIFEASIDSTNGNDGNWFNINAVRSNANTIENNTGVIAGPPAYAFEITVAGYRWFRVRATALTSGSVPVNVYATESQVEVAPAAQTHAVTASGATFGATITPAVPSVISFVSAASTNGGVDKATAGSLFEISASNPTATPAFLKLYNKATAPTVGTDVPVLTIPIPASGVVNLQFGLTGKRFSAGIGHAVTAAIAATDTGVTVAGIQVHGSYV